MSPPDSVGVPASSSGGKVIPSRSTASRRKIMFAPAPVREAFTGERTVQSHVRRWRPRRKPSAASKRCWAGVSRE